MSCAGGAGLARASWRQARTPGYRRASPTGPTRSGRAPWQTPTRRWPGPWRSGRLRGRPLSTRRKIRCCSGPSCRGH
eukprot:15483788-Alexandrium_andersonii.AAC.1